MYNKKLLSKIDLGKFTKSDPYKKDIIYDPMGQWKYPGQNTRIPSSNITMKGLNKPLLGVASTGEKKMMQPGQEYNFPGADYVDEFPQAKKGGSLKSKKYTRSLDGIGSLFVESALFQKPKNNKRRIFHPKAKYYQDGGTKLSTEDEIAFQKFYNTLPDNLMQDDPEYDIRGYWDSEGRPEEFNYNQPKEDDGYYHAYSINSNTGEYLKAPTHPTFQHAVDEDRKIGFRPVTNVQGRNIAVENESIIEPEAQSFLRNMTGPVTYAEGGEPCPKGYIRYNGRCIEWQEPNVIETDENTGYNAATGEIKQDTRPGSIENNGWWTGHEKFHHLQNLAGDMSTAGFLGQRPNNTVVSDQAMGDYYNKRKTELEAETDAMIKSDPNLQFIPRNKLQESTEGFVGANDLIYSKPGVEGDARKYEEYIRGSGESIFPQNKYGGLHKFIGGGMPSLFPKRQYGGSSGCPKGYYWNGKKCVKIPKGAKVITNPKEYSERKAAYQDSSDLYKSSLGIKRFFPKLPEITEEKYDELTKKYDDLPIWNIDKVGYKEDKKLKIKKPIESYIYSYKNKDQFENPTFIKNNKDLYTDYGDNYEKYQIKLKNGDIKIPGIVYKGKPDFNTAYTIISPNGTSRDYHLNYETNKFDLWNIDSPKIKPIHRSYYGSDKLKKDGSIDFSSTGWYGKGKKPNKNELKQWLNHTLEFEYFDTYKKPVQPVVFQEVDKSVLPTTRTVYIDCPPGSVSNGQKTEVTTFDPDSPGNYLKTITTGCDPIKEKEVIVPTKEPVINTEEVPMGTQEYPEELKGSNWEWDKNWHSFTTPRLNKHFPLGPLFNGKKKHTFSTPSLQRRKDYDDGGSISKYNINTEHDLTDAEVARLKKLGYKLEKL